MKVRAVKSFAGRGVSHGAGDIFELPENVDWLQAGLVEPVEEAKKTATAEPDGETAAPKKTTRRRRTTK